jgi:hypothetical protein
MSCCNNPIGKEGRKKKKRNMNKTTNKYEDGRGNKDRNVWRKHREKGRDEYGYIIN